MNMSLRVELDDMKTKYSALSEEWGLQQEHLGRLQSQITKLQNQLQQQSAFCASLGAVLGHLLWRASRSNKLIESLTVGSRIGDFLCMVVGTLKSFMETYKRELPSQESDECQFVMALVGIITNIAAASEGRQFLVCDANGKDAIKHFIKTLDDIPTPSGNCLKRLIYMALYNISINYMGLSLLQEQPDLFRAIAATLSNSDPPEEQHIMALRLLQSLTWDVECNHVFNHLTTVIPMNILEKFIWSSDPEFKNAASAIINNMDKNKVKLKAVMDGAHSCGSAGTIGSVRAKRSGSVSR